MYGAQVTHSRIPQLLKELRLNVDILYEDGNKKYTPPTEQEIRLRNYSGANGAFEKFYTFNGQGEMEEASAWEAGSKYGTLPYDIMGRTERALCFPSHILQRLLTPNMKVFPELGQCWEEFAEEVNFSLTAGMAKYVAPQFEWKSALESYLIEDVTILNAGGKMHDQSVKTLALAFFDALENAYSAQAASMLPRSVVLGDLNIRNQHNGQSRWGNGFVGFQRALGVLETRHLAKSLTFVTTTDQINRNVVDTETTLKKFTEGKVVETVVVDKVEIEEDVVQYKPVKLHESRMAANNKAGF